uniref:Uncharacterized protein n=1 Tax=viral metagenome TaxID=1070528 RepID=A0A6C0C7C7_9ZZZZ
MSQSNISIPEEFCKVIKDFTTDLLTTFPEYSATLDPGLVDILEGNCDTNNVKTLFEYVKNTYPERFFDLLYQNEDIFTDETVNTEFLPGIVFGKLWSPEISENTKLIIWKYLQLLLFSVINTENDDKSFGDAAKLFEAINEDELRKKLEETMEQMSNVFDMSGGNPFTNDASNSNQTDLPDPDELHKHINGMLQGNLGKLAAEITEETMKELNTDMSGASSVGDIFQNLFKNPGKLMGMIKKVGSKLDTKLKSGELNESEVMQEAMDLMQQMESMPGMANMKNMLNQMGMSGLGKNGKINMNAMKGKLNQNMRGAKQKERMLRKLEERKVAKKDEQIQLLQQQLAAAKEANHLGVAKKGNVGKRRRKKKKPGNKK